MPYLLDIGVGSAFGVGSSRAREPRFRFVDSKTVSRVLLRFAPHSGGYNRDKRLKGVP